VSTGFSHEPGSREPGLDHLIRALTADGYPHELAGRDAALAAFRAARSQPRRRLRFTLLPGASARLSAVAAALIAAFAGFTAAAYAQALPGPMQHIAYSVLAPFGVPDSRPASGAHPLPTPRPASGPATVHGHGKRAPTAAASCPCRAAASHPAIKGSVLTLATARTQLPADGWDVFTGRLTYHGRPEPGVRLRLLEQVAGAAGWKQAGSGVTGPHGGIKVAIPHLTQNATFMLAGRNGVSSTPIAVTVTPRVLLWQAPAPPGMNRLVAGARFGDPGDVVTLQELSAGSWQSVATQALGAGHRASFDLAAGPSGGHYYRVLLQATSAHGASVSKPVFEPRVKAAIGAHVIEQHPGLPGPGVPGPWKRRRPVPGPVPPGPVLPGPVPSGPGVPGPVLPGPVTPGPVKP